MIYKRSSCFLLVFWYSNFFHKYTCCIVEIVEIHSTILIQYYSTILIHNPYSK